MPASQPINTCEAGDLAILDVDNHFVDPGTFDVVEGASKVLDLWVVEFDPKWIVWLAGRHHAASSAALETAVATMTNTAP